MNARYLLAVMLCALLQQGATAADVWESTRALFNVSYESELHPIEVNRIHHWVLHIKNAAGDPVIGAHIEVTRCD